MKRKLAILRTHDADPKCPFGLPVPMGCKCVGGLIDKMALVEEVEKEYQEDMAESNSRILAWEMPKEPCKYAGQIIDDKGVECNYGAEDEGISSDKTFLPFPFYTKVYNNVACDGLYTYPMGYYADGNISRNLYYGLYSLQGGLKVEIQKFAELLSSLEKDFDIFPNEIKEILVNFAASHANKNELIKTADVQPDVENINNILMIWKNRKLK